MLRAFFTILGVLEFILFVKKVVEEEEDSTTSDQEEET